MTKAKNPDELDVEMDGEVDEMESADMECFKGPIIQWPYNRHLQARIIESIRPLNKKND